MIPFSSYMNEWLYGKDGYYQNIPIGKQGDFYTSVSVSKFFGGTLAHHLLELLETKQMTLPLKIIEIGADRGHLIGDVAEFLSALSFGVIENCKFISIEPLAQLALSQKNNFLTRLGLELEVYEKLEDINLDPLDCAFVFCNELFDAFPCEIFHNGKMAYVDKHSILWAEPYTALVPLMEKYQAFEGELPIGLKDFIFMLVQKLKKAKTWRFLTFDYGQWGMRNDINLRVYQNHQVYNFSQFHKNLENFYQKSDITYDVDFSLVSDFFECFGAKRLFFDSQGKVMLDLGLSELLEKFAQSSSYEIYLREVSKIKPLISPGGLGERFQGIGFGGGEGIN